MKKIKYIMLGFCDSDSCSPTGKYILRTRLGGDSCPFCKRYLYMQRQPKSKDNHYAVQIEKRAEQKSNAID